MAENVKKNVNYIGRDFSALRENIQTYIKSYFGDTYKDFTEASAANKIAGKVHPNVYTVHMVRKLPQSVFKKNVGPFIVVYDFLEYPNKHMADSVNQLENLILWSKDKKKVQNTFYYWNSSMKGKIVSFAKEFVDSAKNFDFGKIDVSISPFEKYSLLVSSSKLNWSKDEQEYLYAMFLFFGVWSGFNSYESLVGLYNSMVGSKKFDYLCQLASGLTFLKHNGINFDDLKTSNIMQKNGEIVIIDIGKSKVEGSETIKQLTA